MTRTMTHEARLYSWPPTREVAKVVDMRVTEDTGWMPRWSAVVTVVTTPELLSNPPEYLTCSMRRVAAQAIPLSAWTARYGGSVAEMTLHGAWSPEKITAALGGDSNAAAPTELTVTLMVRDYSHDLARGTTTINLTGCEMVLADRCLLIEPKYVLLDSGTMTYARANTGFLKGTPMSEMVTSVLSWVGAALIEYPTSDYALRDIYEWDIGTSPDSLMREILEDRDVMLWAENPNAYILRNRPTAGTPHQVTAASGLINAEYTNDIGAANVRGGMRLAESATKSYVEVTYYGDAPGLINGHFTETKIKTVPNSPPGTVKETRVGNKPRTGSRSHVIKATAVSAYQYRADDRARVLVPDRLDRTGTIRSVTYHYPGGLAELDIESAQPAT